MSLGVFMKGLNAIHFRHWNDLIHEFIPQILLLWVLFGYMDCLIIIKWTTDYTHHEYKAPSIIAAMINMFLKLGKVEPGMALIGSEITN
jgi:V-type H+-transporting ATPase subunit a